MESSYLKSTHHGTVKKTNKLEKTKFVGYGDLPDYLVHIPTQATGTSPLSRLTKSMGMDWEPSLALPSSLPSVRVEVIEFNFVPPKDLHVVGHVAKK